MIVVFKRFRQQKKLEEQLLQLTKQMASLQETMKDVQTTPHYHINIEKIDVQRATLENLTFRLDKLDIDELSGALNLGNNFGVTVGEKKLKAGEKPPNKVTSTKVNTTPKGYSFSFEQKKEE
ncbi:MAG: hypothetical protein ACI35O_13480 [Bacillaceae bacterium]